jgi:predicted transcriptional regulator
MVVIKVKGLDIIAGTIANRRKSLGLTQGQLAERSGVGQSMVAQIESGGRVPHLMTFVSILSALDMVLKMENEV